MDSSLTWDSIQFKEMSFAINILSQDFVASGFPASFLVDIKCQLPSIQAALRVLLAFEIVYIGIIIL